MPDPTGLGFLPNSVYEEHHTSCKVQTSPQNIVQAIRWHGLQQGTNQIIHPSQFRALWRTRIVDGCVLLINCYSFPTKVNQTNAVYVARALESLARFRPRRILPDPLPWCKPRWKHQSHEPISLIKSKASITNLPEWDSDAKRTIERPDFLSR